MQHAADFLRSNKEIGGYVGAQGVDSLCQFQLGIKLGVASHGNSNMGGQYAALIAGPALSDVRRNGDRRPLEFGSQHEPVGRLHSSRGQVDIS